MSDKDKMFDDAFKGSSHHIATDDHERKVDSEQVEVDDKSDKEEVLDADNETKKLADNQQVEDAETELLEMIQQEVEDDQSAFIDNDLQEIEDETKDRSNFNKMAKVMVGVSLVSLSLGAGGLFTALYSLGLSQNQDSTSAMYGKQLSSLKTDMVNLRQSSTYNTSKITELEAGVKNATASTIESEDNLATALKSINKIEQGQQRQVEFNSQFETNLANLKKSTDLASHSIDQISAKLKQVAVKKTHRVSTVRHSNTGTKTHTIRHTAPRKKQIEHVRQFSGIRLASIDGWDGAYSATLTTPNDQFKIVNPGYLINGYVVNKITAHNLYLTSPSGQQLVLEQ
ncbi:hypothetical protein [Photobacterium damselae]|uniref:hypothetical protein n=1 Tax=Photobacterium damselae TaxID=38293 RepID=UPI00406816AF